MEGALSGGGSSEGGGGGISPSLGLDLSGDSVKIPPALAGQATSAILILLHNLQGLKGLKIDKYETWNGYKTMFPDLKSLPGDTSGSPVPVGGAAAVTHSDAIDLPDGGHSDGRPEIKWNIGN